MLSFHRGCLESAACQHGFYAIFWMIWFRVAVFIGASRDNWDWHLCFDHQPNHSNPLVNYFDLMAHKGTERPLILLNIPRAILRNYPIFELSFEECICSMYKGRATADCSQGRINPRGYVKARWFVSAREDRSVKTLCGPQSMGIWLCNDNKRFQESCSRSTSWIEGAVADDAAEAGSWQN